MPRRQLKRVWMVSFARLEEVQLIKQATKPDFICLTPGIRPQGAAVGDQNA